MRRRVLFISHWYPSAENSVRGVFVREYALALARDSSVAVIAFAGWAAGTSRIQVVDYSVEGGIVTVRFSPRRSLLPGIGMLNYYYCVLKAFRMHKRAGFVPDIIHAHVYQAALPAVLIGRLYQIPVVVSEHSTTFVRDTLPLKERLKARIALGAADAVLPVSHFLQRRLGRGGFGKRYYVVPNVVDESKFHLTEVIRKDRASKKSILAVGMLHDGKGYPVLLQALGRLARKRRDFLVEIVGGGDMRGAYEKTARDLGLDNEVRFRGALSKSAVARCMAACDFFVLPSLVETFGVVYIEALACGKPVIASSIGGPREIIGASDGLLVVPGSPESLADAIDRMLDTYWVYDAHAISGRAVEKYGRSAVVRRLNEVYDGVLEAHRR